MQFRGQPATSDVLYFFLGNIQPAE